MNPMMKQKFLNQYQQTSIETGMENATPHKLVVLLYDGVVDALALVKGAIERKDFRMKADKINKAITLVGALRVGLDMENGGDVAKNYADIYSYINQQLLQVSLKNDLEVLNQLAGLVRELRESWDLMPNNMKMASKEQLDNLKKVKVNS
ncbi:flagellar export chaperone FliS [Hydrogenovibrio kuenenii]|uniref:flagellar export chaperone FliS n=1 Tax=Hydrogenovibrio kuenenii TaxID=63658 RepID=UPI0004677C5F|nr:flagellar export chaperone FliS [Hydrogenovibrio kuenenii]